MGKKKPKILEDFQQFALKDAAFGTAVGIMLGAALRDFINSIVDNLLMPPIAYITSGIDFAELFWVVGRNDFETVEAAKEAGRLVITYGEFINALIAFLITATVLFFLANVLINGIKKRFERKEEEDKKEKEASRKCPYCFTEIHKKAKRCPNCTSKL